MKKKREQQLREELKNTSTDTPHVCSTVRSVLTRDESLSVQDKVLTRNNPEVDERRHRGETNSRVSCKVYVLSRNGKPLMPCSPRKARKLLEAGRAVVVMQRPFVIKLTGASGESVQEVVLGVDSGYEHVGLSAVSKKAELFSAEVELRKDLVKLNTERRMYRRGRRSRHHWYREARFLNRKKKEGWLAPSIRHKLESHERMVDKVKRILPISQVNVEIAKFDIQRIKDPEISGEGYQSGDLLGYENDKAYAMWRDGYKCRKCGRGRLELQEHHVVRRRDGGSDRHWNLMTLCKGCHDKYHVGKIKLEMKVVRGYKAETFMSTVWKRMVEDLRSCNSKVEMTWGYETKVRRYELGLEKSHINDAFVIGGGREQKRCVGYRVKQKRKNNRGIQQNKKGQKPSIRRERYKIQSGDEVKIDGRWLRSTGMHSYGKWISVKGGDGKRKDYKVEKVERVWHEGTMVWSMMRIIEKVTPT